MEPGHVQVMEPKKAATVPVGLGYTYQVKWDGIRILSFCRQGSVVLQTKGGTIKTKTFPELNCLGNISGQPIILDGELVVIKEGRPSFPLILRRNLSERSGLGQPAVNYVVFDILLFKGQDTRSQPLVARQNILASLALPSGPATIIDNYADGEQLFAAVGQRGWEGIVAKKTDSFYSQGKSPSWLKVKHRQSGNFIVVGFTLKGGHFSSLLLGYDWGDGLEYAGKVGSGFTQRTRTALANILPLLTAKDPQVMGAVPMAQWLKPMLTAEVEFMEWTESLTLRAPVIKKLLFEGKEYALS